MIIQPVLSHKHVQIVDEAPVIVPFGPIYTGKTMMLYRLFRFLLVRGYCVCENVIFVEPSLMSAYEELMRKFFERLNKNNIAVATTQLPLLFDVYCEGKSICHILDQTGTSHFDKDNIENPVCLDEIIRCSNKKIWMFMLEPSWDEQILKAAYIKRILEIKAIINPQDKVIFVATKADKFMNTRDIFHKIKLTYSGLFDAFKNKNPITRLIRPYNFDFVAFSAGTFSNNIDGTDMYCVGDDKYPEILWKTVLKNI